MTPTKKNQRGFIARASKEHLSDIVVVITYDLDAAGRFTGYEFYKLMTSLDAPALSIPAHRQATFEEELRVLDKAYFADDASGSIEDRIKKKLAEAYRAGESISVEPIK